MSGVRESPVTKSPSSPGVVQHNPYAVSPVPLPDLSSNPTTPITTSAASSHFARDNIDTVPQWIPTTPPGEPIGSHHQQGFNQHGLAATVAPAMFPYAASGAAAPLPVMLPYDMQQQQMQHAYFIPNVAPQQFMMHQVQFARPEFDMAPQQQQQQQQYYQPQYDQGQGQPRSPPPAQGNAGPQAPAPAYNDLVALQGTFVDSARTASGSSFIQAALKDGADPRNIGLLWGELAPALGDLLLDAHGCYVVKTLMDRLGPQDVAYVLHVVAADEQLGFSMCTHSLHTRRVVQHIIENVDGHFLCDLMIRRCCEIAMTQQGCIVMQRSMDHTTGAARANLLLTICSNVVRFAKDPFANYVVQHLMEVGEREQVSAALWKAMEGSVIELSCNKFASNVIEKCLFHVTATVQHLMLSEMYGAGPQVLYDMLQDSFGNYIIQSSIALATFRDVAFIDEKLRPVLVHTPYGHKIEARLDRRLKGKPVTARSPLLQNGTGAPQGQPRHNNNNNRRASPKNPNGPGDFAAPRHDVVPDGEVPW